MVFVEILVPIFLVMASGALFSRLFRSQIEPLTLFSLYIATPALVFHSLVDHPMLAGEVGRLFFLMVAYTLLIWVVAELVGRLVRLDETMRRAFCLATVPMNVGNYGLPLVRFAFGPASTSFSVLVFVIFNLPLATWAIWMAAGGKLSSLKGIRDAFRIPIFHATIAAFALNAFGWLPPTWFMKAAGLLGEAAIPLLMAILGMQLERTRFVSAPGSLALATILRLGAAPLAAWWLTGLFGFTGLEQKVIVLQTSTPAAVLPLLYALRFDCRPDWIASNLLLSTLVSGASLGLVLHFLL